MSVTAVVVVDDHDAGAAGHEPVEGHAVLLHETDELVERDAAVLAAGDPVAVEGAGNSNGARGSSKNVKNNLPGFVVMAASDPANVYNLPLELVDRDPLSRPRGSGALLVMRGGRVAIAVWGRLISESISAPTSSTSAGRVLPRRRSSSTRACAR